LKNTWQNWLAKRFQMQDEKTLSQRDVLVFLFQQGYLYVVLIILTFIAGVNYANNLILGFCFLISAILCISFYLTFKQLHGLQISLHVQDVGQVGKPLLLSLYFRQPTAQVRYLYVKTDDQIQQCKLTETQYKLALSFTPAERGQFHFPVVQIYTVYPFGLVRAWSYLYHRRSAWIAPQSRELTVDRKLSGTTDEPDFDEFRELKKFQLGDSLQAVSWKQAARGQGLYVKVFEQQENDQQLDIYYEHMPSISHEERLKMMMGIVEQCEQLKVPYQLVLPKITLARDVGEKQFEQAKKALAQA
jgi:uncharacterized protein (DUF58 family)